MSYIHVFITKHKNTEANNQINLMKPFDTGIILFGQFEISLEKKSS